MTSFMTWLNFNQEPFFGGSEKRQKLYEWYEDNYLE